LCAFASLWDGEILLYCVHPRAQSDDLQAQILAWGQARAQRHAQRWGERATLCVPLRDDEHRDAGLLEHQGFTPEAWSTLLMARLLHIPIRDPAVPEGYTVRQLAGEAELEAIVVLHQQSFTTTSAANRKSSIVALALSFTAAHDALAPQAAILCGYHGPLPGAVGVVTVDHHPIVNGAQLVGVGGV
jgi:hypothetical protein